MSRTRSDEERRSYDRRGRRARRRRKKKRLKRLPVLIIICLIVILALIGVAGYLINRISPTKEKADLQELYGAEEGYASVLADSEWSENRALWQDGQAYLDIAIVTGEMGTRFYWDASEHKLLYSLPEETITADADSVYEGAPVFIERDGTVYISAEYTENYSNITVDLFEEPARVVIRTDWDDVQVAPVIKDTYVRVKGGIKSLVITEVKTDQQVVVLETMDNWTKVQTEDGWIGYMENSAMGEVTDSTEEAPSREPTYSSISAEQPVCLVWQQSLNSSCIQQLEKLLESDAVKTVNTVGPTWFCITDADGSISDRSNKSYVQMAHNNGLKVWAVLDNVNIEVDMLSLLSSTERRSRLVSNVMDAVIRSGADGLNLDLESISSEMAAGYVQLIREFSIECRRNQIVLSVDDPVPAGWNSYYNMKEQGIVADYVVIMAYDEHYSGSDEMGSTASLDYVQTAIHDTYEQVPAGKMICGIPFYSRLWKETLTSVTSEAIGMDGMQEFISQYQAVQTWDDAVGQNYARAESGDTVYHLWVEDARSCDVRLNMISGYAPAGIACWKQGMQSSDIWDVLAKYYPVS